MNMLSFTAKVMTKRINFLELYATAFHSVFLSLEISMLSLDFKYTV